MDHKIQKEKIHHIVIEKYSDIAKSGTALHAAEKQDKIYLLKISAKHLITPMKTFSLLQGRQTSGLDAEIH